MTKLDNTTVTTRRARGLVEWIVLICTPVTMIVAVSLAWQKISSQCETFTKQIDEMKADGTALSRENATKVVRLEEKFASIDQRLVRIEQSQQRMIDIQMELITNLKRQQP